MVKEQQTERIGIRFTPSEARMLEELSEASGMSMTDVVREAIRRAYAEYEKGLARPPLPILKRKPKK